MGGVNGASGQIDRTKSHHDPESPVRFVSGRPAWLKGGVAASNAMRMAAAALACEAQEFPPTKRDEGSNAHSNFPKSAIRSPRADAGLPDAVVVRLLDGVARLRAGIRLPFAVGKLKP